ncbi:MAG: hypothetical protein Kow00127_10110 [Bacteroidales bacterium]
MLLFISFNHSAEAQQKKVVTEKFTVSGVCGMCEKRIEKAALIKGVKMADWNKETKELTVIYKPSKVSLDEIHKAVAKAGHDTGKVTASDEVYAKLPACCRYRDGVEPH